MTILRRLFLCSVIAFSNSEVTQTTEIDSVVSTLAGKVSGSVEEGVTGHKYLAFKGVPYAKPPVGELRFEDPVQIEPWSGVREAKEYGLDCPQSDRDLNSQNYTSEDCLFVNVFVGGTSIPSQKRPVMVWIYGGGLQVGDGDDDLYGPDYFIRKDIVLVTFNYRLNVFGFLNLEDDIAPGNQGLKDQILVLKWVRDNIARFGGDPDNVTIFGESAGGWCVHFLALSPASKGLFHKAIIQSGVILHPVVEMLNPKIFAYEVCKLLGKVTKNHKEIKEFLKTVDFKNLTLAQAKLSQNATTIPFSFATDTGARNPAFLKKIRETAWQGIQVPLIIGYTSDEFLDDEEDLKNDSEKWSTNFEDNLPPSLKQHLKNTYNLSLDDFKRLYFEDDKVTEKSLKNLITLLTDAMIIEPTHQTIKIQVEKSSKPTYFYVYSYDKTLSAIKKLLNITTKGASHFDEIETIFRVKAYEREGIEPLEKGSPHYKLMEQMTEMWVKFATTGNPTPATSELIPTTWLPVNDGSKFRYLNIGENLEMEEMPSVIDFYTRLTLASPKNQ